MEAGAYGCGADVGQRPLVSAVVVNFNAGRLLGEVVGALFDQAVPVEILVVDNASRDGSVAALHGLFGADRRLTVVRNPSNIGFAAAANIGLARARAEFILLLNPDCVLERGALERVLEALRAQPRVGMAGCLIRNPDGSEQAGCRRAVPTPWRSVVRVLRLNKLFPHHPRFRSFNLRSEPLPTEPVEVEATSGAFMLVRRTAMREVGLLDEDYFMHCEDLDWCMRFRQQGWKILFVPSAEAVHYKGTCSRDRPIRVEWHKHRGMLRFYSKFFRHQYPRPLMWAVGVTVWTRFGLLASRAMFQRALNGRQRLAAPGNMPAPAVPVALRGGERVPNRTSEGERNTNRCASPARARFR
jgi:hypothetical protein